MRCWRGNPPSSRTTAKTPLQSWCGIHSQKNYFCINGWLLAGWNEMRSLHCCAPAAIGLSIPQERTVLLAMDETYGCLSVLVPCSGDVDAYQHPSTRGPVRGSRLRRCRGARHCATPLGPQPPSPPGIPARELHSYTGCYFCCLVNDWPCKVPVLSMLLTLYELTSNALGICEILHQSVLALHPYPWDCRACDIFVIKYAKVLQSS